MIRKLLWAWLVIGTALMIAGIAHGQQVIYRQGPLGGQRYYSSGIGGPVNIQGPWQRSIGQGVGCATGQCQGGACTTPGGGPAWQPSRPMAPPSLPPATGSGTIPQVQGGTQARTPSPVVVAIESKRGDVTKHGTGALVDFRGNLGLVVTVAHILQAGYEPTVVFSDGDRAKAAILATDALHDAALLVVTLTSNRQVFRMAAAPPQSGPVYWEGWGGGQYAGSSGTVLGIDGDFIRIRGQPRDGDSGAPIYTHDGAMVGLLAEGSQVPGQPWESAGPHIGWIRAFIAQHWPPVTGTGLASTQPATQPPGVPAVSAPLPPAPSPPVAGLQQPAAGSSSDAATLADLKTQMSQLQAAIQALADRPPVPGPVGPQGPPGPPGSNATLGPWYLKGLDPKTGQMVEIPIMPGDKVHLLEPMNVSQVTVEHASK